MSPTTEWYKNIFNLSTDAQEEISELKPPGLKIRKLYKVSAEQKNERRERGEKNIPQYDFDPDSEGDEDDGNYVDMVRTALKDSRRILGDITPDSPLYTMIKEIYNIFSGSLGGDDDEVNKIKLEGVEDDGKQRLELLALPKFVNYFKVTA